MGNKKNLLRVVERLERICDKLTAVALGAHEIEPETAQYSLLVQENDLFAYHQTLVEAMANANQKVAEHWQKLAAEGKTIPTDPIGELNKMNEPARCADCGASRQQSMQPAGFGRPLCETCQKRVSEDPNVTYHAS